MKKHVVLIILAFLIAFFAFSGAVGCRDCDGDGFPETLGTDCGLLERTDVLM